ncbi:MAG: NAD(P)/FAD-dependent oxidoreductase [Kiloniellales bacterium]
MTDEGAAPTLPREVEVAVIGGGIAGVSTAYFLAKAGVPVALFEKGRIAGEQSSRNWGWVRKQRRDPAEIPAMIESSRIWQGLEREIGADIGWHQGGVAHFATTEAELDKYESWLEHARPYQLDSRLLSAKEADELVGQTERRWKGALFTASDGRAEPAKAAPAIAQAAERLGAQVFAGCAVRTVETAAGRVAGVVTERGRVACRAVVCAAGAWSSYFSRNLGVDFPQLSVRSSALRTTPAPLFTQAGVWGGGCAVRRRQDRGYTVSRGQGSFDVVPDAFRYLRPFLPCLRMSIGNVRLRLGGAFLEQLMRPRRWGPEAATVFERVRMLDPEPDHQVLAEGLANAKRQFPALRDAQIAESWAGMIEVTPDALPVLDAAGPEGYFIASGFSGHGFGFGPIAGQLMAELATKGQAHLDLTAFRLTRFSDGSRIQPPFSPF